MTRLSASTKCKHANNFWQLVNKLEGKLFWFVANYTDMFIESSKKWTEFVTQSAVFQSYLTEFCCHKTRPKIKKKLFDGSPEKNNELCCLYEEAKEMSTI